MEASDSHEPSYYEIALTNRQVVVAFVILLVCLLSAFFSGVWIGRESTLRTQEQIARNGAAAQPEAEKEGQSLEEFEFFDEARKPVQPGAGAANAGDAGDTDKTAEPEPPPAETTRDTTLAEDLGSAPTTRPAQPPAPAPAVPTPGAREPEEEPARRPEPEPERPVRPRPLPEAEPAAPRSGVVIQVFSSAEKDQAEKIRDRLVSGGHKAFLSPVEVAGRTMYRVRIGPFEARDRAQKVAEQVRKTYKLDTWVTE